MSDEPPMVRNMLETDEMQQLINSENEIAAFQQDACVQKITNPKITEISNQATAGDYNYMKPRRRY